MTKINNANIQKIIPLISPATLKKELPLSKSVFNFIKSNRDIIENIISGKDKRVLAIVGPCSIHDHEEAIEYALKLKSIQKKIEDKLFLMMRVYFEKPRTTIGWKGLINDPDMDESNNVPKGLRVARKLLIDIAQLNIPAASEVLDPITPQYISDLVSWAAVGARTTESQTHREMASGLSMPVGFKNGTDGNLDVAIAALQSAKHAHSFIGIDSDGTTAIIRTKGNKFGHLILRGGNTGTNYKKENIEVALNKLKAAGENCVVVVDCSHANSEKNPDNQPKVLKNVISQIADGNNKIIGFMVESNLEGGNQKITENIADLKYGVSVTDACLCWAEMEKSIIEAYKKL
jgi:3-deoxy-7-phosphoheptulonate synthase